MLSLFLPVFAVVSSALAASSSSPSSTTLSPAQITHVIQVANNLTATNGSAVFTPNVVNASLGETVLFNFTVANRSAIQSTFASPCIPAHETNSTINGFDTDIRPANTIFTVVMNPDIVNTTLWFYDQASCGIGGVGVINPGNVTATDQPFDAFVRNAERLNGTATASSSASSASNTSPSSGSGGGSGSGSSSGSSSTTTSAALPLAAAPAAFVPILALAAAALASF